jgi:hypothetical protein
MANVLNRTTREFKNSVNEPDYPLVDWIHDPDMTAISGFSYIHWIITGDVVTLMDQAARDVVDAATEATLRDSLAANLIDPYGILRSVAIIINNELQTVTNRSNAIKNAIANATSLDDLKATAAATPDLTVMSNANMRDLVRAKIGEVE